MTTVISVENLSKVYRLGQIGSGTFANDLKLWWAKTRGNPNPLLRIGETDHGNLDGEDLWALKDVSFTVEQGEILGIIGKNGAGKSTLLKILSRVTAPSSGRVKLKGRIASLLEVGTGFHPELTGRENIYLNGAILGMGRSEIGCKFDEIVDFAEVEKFIDTPVKRYSSGMYVRLAFAVAAHLDPEILVVDEVLAVGDADFQKKCLGKMGQVAKRGRTIFFVSHNMAAINKLCNRTILLSHGRMLEDGETSQVVAKYLSSDEGNREGEVVWDDIKSAPGSEMVKLHAVRVCSKGILVSQVDIDQPVEIEIEFWNQIPGQKLVPDIRLVDEFGTVVFEAIGLPNADLNNAASTITPLEKGLYRSVCIIPPNFLNDKRYFVSIKIVNTPSPVGQVSINEVVSFLVYDTGAMRAPQFNGKWLGVIRTPFHWHTEKIVGGHNG